MDIEEHIKRKLMENVEKISQEKYKISFKKLIEPYKTIVYELAIKDAYKYI